VLLKLIPDATLLTLYLGPLFLPDISACFADLCDCYSCYEKRECPMFGTIVLIVLVVLVGLAVVPRLLLPLVFWFLDVRSRAACKKYVHDRVVSR
jgi:hypothetical protein